MALPAVERQPRKPRSRSTSLVGLLGAGLLLLSAGCSEVPDWANPIEWYHGTADAVEGVFSDEEEEAAALPPEEAAPTIAAAEPAEAPPVPGAEEPFPNLATVPEKPPAVTPPQEVEQLMTGLAADREHAQYTNEVLRGESEAASLAQLPPTPNANVPVTAEPLAVAESSVQGGAAPAAAEAYTLPPAPAEPLAPSYAAAEPAVEPPSYMAAPAVPPSSGSVGIEDFKQRFNQAFEASGTKTYTAAGGLAAGPTGAYSGVESGKASGLPGVPVPSVSFLAAVVYFGDGQAWLSQGDRAMLNDVAALHRRTGGFVRVVGHASQRTRDMEYAEHKLANFELSAKRAQIVADDLIRQGVPAERIVVTAAGDDQPSSYEFMPSGEAENRRTEIFIEY